jgi:hypothetical protein
MLSEELKKLSGAVNLRWLARDAGVGRSTIYQRMHLGRAFSEQDEVKVLAALLRLRKQLDSVIGGSNDVAR